LQDLREATDIEGLFELAPKTCVGFQGTHKQPELPLATCKLTKRPTRRKHNRGDATAPAKCLQAAAVKYTE